ncbi:MAG: dienelactone hydrolase family protein [Devosia sp.]|uniref:dienelactone hydrolase family protein n=1 Tax=Devosia sp. TaxID=1871048 RepID=UPI001AC820ED|nr:dienelactone hydrolase family protein [Devosia sp.]MBN9309109.1 dienelactone hydrolase family protein [Devosia sp.]MBN9315036.1 dienelactone hydrolase family protein [Devosia sp.]
MGERFKLTASDGFVFGAYRARPEGKVRGGVVLIQEVWGLNNWIRSVADRWARHGYLTIAPSLFDRVEPGFESENYGPDHFARVGELMKTFSMDKAVLDVEAAIKSASEGGKVGITGYCFGGRVTWIAASRLPGLAAASGYYGGGVPNYIDLAPRVPIEMHFGDKDQGIPLEQVEQLKARHPEADIHVYHADHGFCNSDRPEKFDEAACTRASARSLEFFHKHLG